MPNGHRHRVSRSCVPNVHVHSVSNCGLCMYRICMFLHGLQGKVASLCMQSWCSCTNQEGSSGAEQEQGVLDECSGGSSNSCAVHPVFQGQGQSPHSLMSVLERVLPGVYEEPLGPHVCFLLYCPMPLGHLYTFTCTIMLYRAV